MNNDLVRNMSIICNHAEKTQKNYENALRKYCEYFNQSIPELLSESEEDENNNVKWKNCCLKAKLLEYRHHLLENSALNTAKKTLNAFSFFTNFMTLKYSSYLELVKSLLENHNRYTLRICLIRKL